MNKFNLTEEHHEPVMPNNLDRRAVINIGDESIEVEPENIETLQQLGRGAYGIVERVRHRPSMLEMAVKVNPLNSMCISLI